MPLPVVPETLLVFVEAMLGPVVVGMLLSMLRLVDGILLPAVIEALLAAIVEMLLPAMVEIPLAITAEALLPAVPLVAIAELWGGPIEGKILLWLVPLSDRRMFRLVVLPPVEGTVFSEAMGLVVKLVSDTVLSTVVSTVPPLVEKVPLPLVEIAALAALPLPMPPFVKTVFPPLADDMAAAESVVAAIPLEEEVNLLHVEDVKLSSIEEAVSMLVTTELPLPDESEENVEAGIMGMIIPSLAEEGEDGTEAELRERDDIRTAELVDVMLLRLAAEAGDGVAAATDDTEGDIIGRVTVDTSNPLADKLEEEDAATGFAGLVFQLVEEDWAAELVSMVISLPENIEEEDPTVKVMVPVLTLAGDID